MTGRKLMRELARRGCHTVRQRGSHARVSCGRCQTTVPIHSGADLPVGTLRAIERDLEPCLGEGWAREV